MYSYIKMPIQQPSDRTTRYQNRCSKKSIEEQKVQRAERYEKRCALRQEAKQSVSEEMQERTLARRTSERHSVSRGFFGSFF